MLVCCVYCWYLLWLIFTTFLPQHPCSLSTATIWKHSRWSHPPNKDKESKSFSWWQTGAESYVQNMLLHCTEGDSAFAMFSCQLIGLTDPYARVQLNQNKLSQTLAALVSCSFSALLHPSRYSSLNLGSPQTTHNHYVWLQRGDESCWPRLWFWGSSSSRLRRTALAGLPGTVGIEQGGEPEAQSIKKGAVSLWE